MHVFRPADEVETKAAWYSALTSAHTPTCLVLSRQNLPAIEQTGRDALRGGYILKKESGEAIDMIFMATGSEVSVALEAAGMLEQDGISVRVVSMPCMDLFAEQDEAYQEEILPKSVAKRVVVEAGSGMLMGKIRRYRRLLCDNG